MEKGLSAQQVLMLQGIHGKNTITSQKKSSPFIVFLSQFPSVLNGILASAGIFSFVIGDVLDGSFILAILILNGVFGFVQEYRAEKSLEKLKNLLTPQARVIRDGKELQISTENIVIGDIVILSEGDRVPADGIVHMSHHIEIDESLLTGESLPVIKDTKEEVYGGTLVTKGKAHVQITKIGMQTKFGEIAQNLSTIETNATPLQIRLNHLGKVLSVIAIIIALSLIPIGLYRHLPLFPLILLAISVGVAAIPEGLPAVITIALAIGTGRMAKKHAIVRKLPSVETLGSVQVIITDKTGTLTQNNMRVKKHLLIEKNSLKQLVLASILGNSSSLVKKGDNNGWDIVGDKTDGALMLWANENYKDLDRVKSQGKVVDEFVFDPNTKTIATIWELDQKHHIFVRGAPEEILAKSTLSEKEKKKITSLFEEFAKEGLRVVGFGTKITEMNTKSLKRTEIENNLTFLGIMGIYDPPRPEAKKAIASAKMAGIIPIMVTGDNELTAMAIAREVGLLEESDDVMTGDELRKLSDNELKIIILKTRVFARTRPEDKLRLTTVLQNMGYIVGVTGDGVNDALALKKADVGIAMGESGTEVAKEAADIVLTDDNFATIVSAVEEGRTIYSNILKSITYLLSGNLAEVTLVFGGAVLGLPMVLLPTQVLWLNLVTDGLPSLALASDSRNPELLQNKPRDPISPILNKNILLFISLVGFGIAGICLVLFMILLKTHSVMFARTIVFNLLIFLHVSIAFFVRGGSILRVNKLLIGGVLLTFAIQIAVSTIPFFQHFLHLGF